MGHDAMFSFGAMVKMCLHKHQIPLEDLFLVEASLIIVDK